jgi:hypothetical protein
MAAEDNKLFADRASAIWVPAFVRWFRSDGASEPSPEPEPEPTGIPLALADIHHTEGLSMPEQIPGEPETNSVGIEYSKTVGGLTDGGVSAGGLLLVGEANQFFYTDVNPDIATYNGMSFAVFYYDTVTFPGGTVATIKKLDGTTINLLFVDDYTATPLDENGSYLYFYVDTAGYLYLRFRTQDLVLPDVDRTWAQALAAGPI